MIFLKYCLISFTLILTLNITVFSQNQDNKICEIDNHLTSVFSEDSPGCQVLIKKGGRILLNKSYGLADIESGSILTDDYSMPIGSLTKQFTAMAVYILEQENLLNINDPISKYIPEASNLKAITIHQLLTHTSGIIDYFKIDEWREDLSTDLTPIETLGMILREDLEFLPGTSSSYSNSGYHILGIIIEKVSGKPLNEFIRENIVNPLKMENTFFIEDKNNQHLIANGYEYRNGELVEPVEVSKSRFFAGGSMITNVSDLSKWDDALYTEILVNQSELRKYFSPFVTLQGDTLTYASGWECIGADNKIYGHGGGINGYVCQVYRVPSQKIFVAVLTNSIKRNNYYSPSKIAQQILDQIMDQEDIKNNPTHFVSDEVLQKYNGKYTLSNNSIRTIKYSKGKIYFVQSNGEEYELYPVSDTQFKAGRGSTFEFIISKEGVVESFKLFTGRGKPIVAKKINN